MDAFILVLTSFGALVLLTAWLPMVLKEMPLSLPMICIAVGAALFSIPGLPGVPPDPRAHLPLVERITEIVVIVALMGAGLKLDRPLDRLSGAGAARLLLLGMPLTIAAIAAAGHLILGLGLAAAILLGACLAPTDPVLASDIQVGAPGRGKEDDVRYTLTAEAGLNDGLAFPFVALAIALAAPTEGWLEGWLAYDLAWRLAAGVAIGWVVGRVLGWATFRLPNRSKLSRTGDGFVALGITGVAYGLAEMAHGYGFLAVFVAAVAFRAVERDHAYHDTLHDFIDQLERLLTMVVLVLFGGALTAGGLLVGVDWREIATAVAVLFVIRPVAGWLSLAGLQLPSDERAVIAVFGIRGIGSAYYLAYALNHASFPGEGRLWDAAALVVLLSVALHGVTVTPVMRRLDARRRPAAHDRGGGFG